MTPVERWPDVLREAHAHSPQLLAFLPVTIRNHRQLHQTVLLQTVAGGTKVEVAIPDIDPDARRPSSMTVDAHSVFPVRTLSKEPAAFHLALWSQAVRTRLFPGAPRSAKFAAAYSTWADGFFDFTPAHAAPPSAVLARRIAHLLDHIPDRDPAHLHPALLIDGERTIPALYYARSATVTPLVDPAGTYPVLIPGHRDAALIAHEAPGHALWPADGEAPWQPSLEAAVVTLQELARVDLIYSRLGLDAPTRAATTFAHTALTATEHAVRRLQRMNPKYLVRPVHQRLVLPAESWGFSVATA